MSKITIYHFGRDVLVNGSSKMKFDGKPQFFLTKNNVCVDFKDCENGFEVKHNDIFAAGSENSFTIFRFDWKQGCFEKGPTNVQAVRYCGFAFLFERKGEWYYQPFGTKKEIFLGLLDDNVFLENHDDLVGKYNLMEWKGLKKFYWVGMTEYFLNYHRSHAFTFGKRENGFYDVITPFGRQYIPRRYCFLKSGSLKNEKVKNQIWGWNEEVRAFQLLFDEAVAKTIFLLNVAVVEDEFGIYYLYGFEENKKILLAEEDKNECSFEDGKIKMGRKIFHIQSEKTHFLDLKPEILPKVKEEVKEKTNGWFERLVEFLS